VTFLPDGGDLQVDASGIRAPVGLTVEPGTGDLLVTMNQRDDLGDATPGDWLAVVRAGQDWGFPDCYGQEDTACTGSPQPLAVLDQHAAVSGVAVVTGQLGATVGTVALVAEWSTGKVLQVNLSRSGHAEVAPFLTGLQRPEPLITTPSGTVLVGDWGSGTVYELTAPAPA
jgi:glucose/arabinose dehydrogenase